MEVTVNIDLGHCKEEVTLEEARKLYDKLDKLFGKKEVKIPEITFPENPWETSPYKSNVWYSDKSDNITLCDEKGNSTLEYRFC